MTKRNITDKEIYLKVVELRNKYEELNGKNEENKLKLEKAKNKLTELSVAFNMSGFEEIAKGIMEFNKTL